MSVFWRIHRFWDNLAQNYYRASFARYCQIVGRDLLVKGPFRARNAGQIEFGESCTID